MKYKFHNNFILKFTLREIAYEKKSFAGTRIWIHNCGDRK